MSLLRRRMMMAKKPSGGGVTFPATLVPAYIIDGESIPNYNIAKYFADKYPNMEVGVSGFKYTPITEDVTITGSTFCDGKVLGIRKWDNSQDLLAILFFTQQGINNLEAFRVAVNFGTDPKGSTAEIFLD